MHCENEKKCEGETKKEPIWLTEMPKFHTQPKRIVFWHLSLIVVRFFTSETGIIVGDYGLPECATSHSGKKWTTNSCSHVKQNAHTSKRDSLWIIIMKIRHLWCESSCAHRLFFVSSSFNCLNFVLRMLLRDTQNIWRNNIWIVQLDQPIQSAIE